VRARSSIGLEAANVSWADQRSLASLLAPALVPTNGLVESLRAVKDDGEVARIEMACDVAGDALGIVFGLIGGEPTEEEFAWALEAEMRRLGASGPSFATIVGTGANGALPHHRADHTRMAGGDLLVLDFGCVVDGYASDMTRTALVGGGEAAGWQRELIDIATTAQAAGVAAVRPGLTGAEIDAVCRASIHDAGLGDLFTHGTGHGVGLQIHEAPWVLATSGDVLQPGNVITIEPGVYRIGLGGVRVEDTVLVTADGCRPLTKTPKDLACLRSPRTT
jgi:Xaa-Pro aminopeptidase